MEITFCDEEQEDDMFDNFGLIIHPEDDDITDHEINTRFDASGNSGNTDVTMWPPTHWVIDSGASVHLTGNIHILSDFKNHSIRLSDAGGKTHSTQGMGDAHLEIVNSKGMSRNVIIHNIHYLSGAPYNLLSVNKLSEAGFDNPAFINQRLTVRGEHFALEKKRRRISVDNETIYKERHVATSSF